MQPACGAQYQAVTAASDFVAHNLRDQIPVKAKYHLALQLSADGHQLGVVLAKFPIRNQSRAQIVTSHEQLESCQGEGCFGAAHLTRHPI